MIISFYKINSGGGSQKQEIVLTATANGTFTPESGKVYRKAVVNVPPTPTTGATITSNGTYTPPEGYDYSGVTVNCPTPKPETGATITENGTYTPQSGYTFSGVTVNCPSADDYIIGVSNGTLSGALNIPQGATKIIANQYNGCSGITSIYIPSSVLQIGDGCFQNCSGITSATISSGVTSIGHNAFSNCRSITTIAIPDSVTSIGNNLFNGCRNLTGITLSDNITNLSDHLFSSCDLRSLPIPANCKKIYSYCFYENKHLPSSIEIPEGVEEISYRVWQYCESIRKCTFPSTLTKIDGNNFNSVMIEEIKCLAITPPSFTGGTFTDQQTLAHIYVPAESVDAYKAATNWSNFASIISAIPE